MQKRQYNWKFLSFSFVQVFIVFWFYPSLNVSVSVSKQSTIIPTMIVHHFLSNFHLIFTIYLFVWRQNNANTKFMDSMFLFLSMTFTLIVSPFFGKYIFFKFFLTHGIFFGRTLVDETFVANNFAKNGSNLFVNRTIWSAKMRDHFEVETSGILLAMNHFRPNCCMFCSVSLVTYCFHVFVTPKKFLSLVWPKIIFESLVLDISEPSPQNPPTKFRFLK